MPSNTAMQYAEGHVPEPLTPEDIKEREEAIENATRDAARDAGPVSATADTEPPPAPATTPAPRKRGFAAWDPAKLAEVGRKGGIAAHAAGTGHRFTSEEAKIAGSKGGKFIRDRKRAAQDP